MSATQVVQASTGVQIDQLCINTIRTLSMDAVQQAKSGHPGASGQIIGMKTLGASAPLKELQKKFGFEPERVTAVARQLLGRP